MSELFEASLPWWGWALLLIGAFSLVGVIGALFLPDWPMPPLTARFDAEPDSDAFVGYTAGVLDLPVHRGGTASILQNGDAFYPAILEAIRSARETVNFEVYIFESDEVGRRFIEAFTERARAGVEVRLLVDWFGALKLKKRDREELVRAGVKLARFRPLGLRNLVRIYRRTHRRAIVIDGRVGFTGGAAIAKKWEGDVRNRHQWRDSMTRVTGSWRSVAARARPKNGCSSCNWLTAAMPPCANPRYQNTKPSSMLNNDT